jgi:hypothetical protein
MQHCVTMDGTIEISSNARSAGFRPEAGGAMENRKNCVYNQTRECFLGLEVAAADVTFADVGNLIARLELKSGEGLWMAPFRGLPDVSTISPLDLLYLDDECCVIDLVESYPTFKVSSSTPAPASVLTLPAHAIYSSQTQPGDQLVICVAEEMERRLERLTGPKSTQVVVQNAVLLREKPLWSGGPGIVQLEERSEERARTQQHHQMNLAEPTATKTRPPRNWLERWWSPDPRKAPRDVSPGVAAYYWDGSTPSPHPIRDISSTGLYLVTEERWYPGTLVLMTLQKTENGEEAEERVISVHTRAVRWGADGVGLQFIPVQSANSAKNVSTDGAADKRALEKFLQGLRKDKN